ncbi:MAG: DUF1460 domain-containing protein [Fidelibacterota bacterium]|nr:MAG: DUF1460 domain-containing protein [Candidatus Neomarinimicrobiota bacterium]
MKTRWCILAGAVLIPILASLNACSNGSSDAESWLVSLPKPWTLTEEQVSQLLPEFQQRFPDLQGRIKALAKWRVGTPYEIYKLGEEVPPDPDPIFRLDVSDCTGHILTTLSLAQSRSWQQARENMIAIHYKPDTDGRAKPTYKSRWHYTTDRITANPATVDITRSLLPEDKLLSVDITLNRKEDGSEFLELDWSREMKAWYIPNNMIDRDFLAKLPEVCGVAFVKPSYFKLGIVVGHEGMIIDRKDLIHASQSEGETVRVDFLDYYFPEDGPFFDGIMVFRFVPLQK